jgi:hypothetical protein
MLSMNASAKYANSRLVHPRPRGMTWCAKNVAPLGREQFRGMAGLPGCANCRERAVTRRATWFAWRALALQRAPISARFPAQRGTVGLQHTPEITSEKQEWQRCRYRILPALLKIYRRKSDRFAAIRPVPIRTYLFAWHCLAIIPTAKHQAIGSS